MTTSHKTPPTHTPVHHPPQHVPPAHPTKGGEGMAIASMVLGIVSIVGFVGLFLGIPAIILGIIALKKGVGERGMSIAGIITGSISTFFSLLFIAFMIFVFVMAANEERNSDSWAPERDYNYSHPRSFSDGKI